MNRKERRANEKRKRKQQDKIVKQRRKEMREKANEQPMPIVEHMPIRQNNVRVEDRLSLKQRIIEDKLQLVMTIEMAQNFAMLEGSEKDLYMRLLVESSGMIVDYVKANIVDAPSFEITDIADEFLQHIQQNDEEENFAWDTMRIAIPANRFVTEFIKDGKTLGAYCEVVTKDDWRDGTYMSSFLPNNAEQQYDFSDYFLVFLTFEENDDGEICFYDRSLLFSPNADGEIDAECIQNTFRKMDAFHLPYQVTLFALGLLATINTVVIPTTASREVGGRDEGDPNRIVTRTVKINVTNPSRRKYGEPMSRRGSGVARHFVRGHFRHYRSGKIVYVRSHYRGDEGYGRSDHTYKLN